MHVDVLNVLINVTVSLFTVVKKQQLSFRLCIGINVKNLGVVTTVHYDVSPQTYDLS